MPLLRITLLALLAAGCASSLPHSHTTEPRREFQALNGVHEVNVRLYSQEAMSGTLEVQTSDTVRGIYTGALQLEGIEFDGDLVAYSAASPPGDLHSLLVQLYNEREVGRAYAYLVLSTTDQEELVGSLRLYSKSRPCLAFPRRHYPAGSPGAALEHRRCLGSRGVLREVRPIPSEAQHPTP